MTYTDNAGENLGALETVSNLTANTETIEINQATLRDKIEIVKTLSRRA